MTRDQIRLGLASPKSKMYPPFGRSSAWCWPLVAASSLLWMTAALAQDSGSTAASPKEAPQATETRSGSYVVRPGDTLETLAAQYLGSAGRWSELWRLNEGIISDPNKIQPGWKLVMVWRELPKESVVLTGAWNEVKDLRPPLRDWENASVNDVLRTRDQVQTFKNASAELTFSDATTLRMSEESLLLLEPTSRQRGRVKREQVQLVTGQADLEGSASSSEDLGIDIVIGGATATPQKDESGQVRARARKVEDQAQLMVFTGESNLQAGGQTIEVPKGMGSTAREGKPPTPPEELLEAPELTEPASGAIAAPQPLLRWKPVAGAVTYSVELCRDSECAQLEQRVTDLTQPSWQAEALLESDKSYFWRVAAQSASGLDGYSAVAREFSVASELTPPVVSFRVTDPHLVPRWGLNSFWILGPDARLEAIADDDASGIDRWTPLLDGEEVDAEQWQGGPWTEGVQQAASFIAIDRAGNRAQLEDVPFVYDATPPALTWGVADSDVRGDVPSANVGTADLTRQPGRAYLKINDPHSWLPWRKQRFTLDSDGRHLVITPNRPMRIRLLEREAVIGPERVLWILADDAICDSVRRLDHRVTVASRGGFFDRYTVLTIEVEAEDLVENTFRGVLEVETLGRK